MKLYVKVKQGAVVSSPEPLPRTFVTESGQSISNFDKLSQAEVKQHGFYEVIDSRPIIDARIQVYGESVYTVHQGSVSMTCGVVDIPVETLRAAAIEEAYMIARGKLDEGAEGYSKIQVAAWPGIQRDVVEYGASKAVGADMQEAMNESGLTADTLAAVIAPKVQFKNEVFRVRNSHIAVLKALALPVDIVNYDVHLGWPS